MHRFNSVHLASALLAGTALGTPAWAQVATDPPPLHRTVDANGVDLVSGDFRFGMTEAVMGSGEGALSLERYWGDSGYRDNWSNGLYLAGNGLVFVEFGDISDSFQLTGGSYVSQKADGATLVTNATGYLYTASDGTQIQFRSKSPTFGLPLQGYACAQGLAVGACAVPVTLIRPNGMRFNLSWDYVDRCDDPLECLTGVSYYRFRGVSSAAGYSFTVNYVSNFPGQSGGPPSNWYIKTGIAFANSVTACSGQCPSLAYAEPTAGVTTITDALGRVWRLTRGLVGLTGIRRPGESSDSTTVAYGTGGLVSSVTRDGVTTGYSRSVSGSTATTTVTNALSDTRTIVADLAKGRLTSVVDELGRTTSYQYDANGRLTRATLPEGNYTQLTYDSRGNVTETRMVAKTPGTPADIAVTASFPASCANPKTCNQPTWTRDALNNQTDFTYDGNHGGVTEATLPAPTTGAVRPKTTFAYTLTASPVAGQPSVWLPTSVSACQTLASCSGGADETRQVIAYAGNLLPSTVTARNGTGSLTATQSMTYDPAGNLLTVDGPLSGTADTTTFRYDAARRRVGTIGPDPDGAGTLKRRAVRITWRPDGQVEKQELGNVNGTSDPDWAAFDPAEAVDLAYDANARVRTRKLSDDAGTAHALTQFSYDALGRLDCSATRMNPAQFGSLPASACSHDTAGSFGPDRISKTIYDDAGQVTQRRVAVGVTGQEAAEATFTWTSNGRLATLKDAEDNLTTYEYDGFDRLLKTRFPNTPKGSGTSSTTDYEQLSYDANSNVTSRRLRDATSIAFTYDKLNRPTVKNLPGTETSETYAYDNLSRLTLASKGSVDTSFAWDALGRATSTTSFLSSTLNTTTGYEYDAASRRTKLTWSDGFFVNYDYLVTGEMTKIRENGATSGIGVLATYAYDNLGRRTSLTFGNGAVTSYTFDPVSRLASLTQNLSGPANDLTIGSIAYSPASQIISLNRSNDAYAFAPSNENVASVANGLNQLTSIGGSATTHDARGNLTTDPTTGNSYAYTAENQLLSGPGSIALRYDGLMRLRQITGAGTQRFAYDGLDLIAEYNGADALQRRYVFGPGIDEPIVWYEGGGTTDRRFLHADERGSIVAVSNSSGALLNVNKYDEFGRPGGSNAGRFQYTGQAWLSEIGVQYSKARMYDPALGRFLQTDPIGYWDSPNLYAYVLNDPINYVDPLGLCGAGEVFVRTAGGEYNNSSGERVVWVTGYCARMPGSGGGGTSVGGPGGPGAPGNGGDPGPWPRPPAPLQAQCRSQTELGRLADKFGTIADVTAVAAIGFGGAAAISSETGVGGVVFGILSVASGLSSGAAKSLEVGTRWIDNDPIGALAVGLDLVTGRVVGAAAIRTYSRPNVGGKAAEKFNDVAAQAAGNVSGAVAERLVCSG